MGFLSRPEAEAKWKNMFDDPDHPRDSDGPRGYTRLRIHIADQIIGYNQTEKKRLLGRQKKLGKDTSKE
eukprot:1518150-Alexandrium_andersonii.AAC.1